MSKEKKDEQSASQASFDGFSTLEANKRDLRMYAFSRSVGRCASDKNKYAA